MMQNNWEKKAKANKMKALTVAVLIHAIFLMGLLTFGGSDSEGGLTDWFKSKFQKEQVDETKPLASIE